MKPTAIAALICVLGIVATSACRQKTEPPQRIEPPKKVEPSRKIEPTKFQEYKAKAEQGNAEAQYKLGNCYAYGLDIAEDAAEAVTNTINELLCQVTRKKIMQVFEEVFLFDTLNP